LPYFELFSVIIWQGQLGGTTTEPGTGTGTTSVGGATGTGCDCLLPCEVQSAVGLLADAVVQLELVTPDTLRRVPTDANWDDWVASVRTYLYRTLALELACPSFWNQIRAWAHQYRPERPGLALLRRALREPRDRVVTAAMLPHAMLGEYTRVIRDLGALLGFPRADYAARTAGFLDQGFESALAGARAALAGMRCPEPAAAAGGTSATGTGTTGTGTGVAGAPLGSGNWSLGETTKRLLNPILWVVEKLYEGYTTDEAPPDLSYIEQGGIGAALTAAAIRIAQDGPTPTRVRGFAVEDLARAVVLEQQLLGHLSANESHYRYAVWTAMDPNDRFNLLSARGDRLLDHVENEVIGFVGRKAVLPYRVDADPDVARWLVDNVLSSSEFVPAPIDRLETVPTAGISTQARLGPCDTGESFVMDLRQTEVRNREAEARLAQARAMQAELEARRRRMRLEHKPPLLDDPVPQQGPVHIALDTERPGLPQPPAPAGGNQEPPGAQPSGGSP
jgi:hypothetical protein